MRGFRVFLAFVFVICFGSIQAQHSLTKEADEAYKMERYFNAVDLYKKAFAKESKRDEKIRIIYQIAESYGNLLDYEQAEVWYEKAVKAQYPDKELHLKFANTLMMQGKYEEALEEYKEYQQVAPGDNRAQEGINNCELAKKWKAKPSGYEVEGVVQLNSKFHDFAPAFSGKRFKKLVFSSSRPGSSGSDIDPNKGQSFTDIYESTVDRKGKWSRPAGLPSEINTGGNEGRPFLDSRATTMYFTRCAVEKNQVLNCQLYTTTKRGKEWNEPAKLAIVNDTINIGHPTLSKDGKTMYFVSDMLGGEGGKDIFYATYDNKEGTWSEPMTVSGVNTSGDELYPFIRDNGMLYFASNGHPGMGGYDLFGAQPKGPGKFSEVENLRPPINSASHDISVIFEGPKDRGFFASDRSGGKGSFDIYSFKMPPIIFALQGTIKDVDCKEPVKGAKVKIVGTDGSSAETTTDELGFYKFDEKENEERFINENTSYTIIVGKYSDVKKTPPDCDKAIFTERGYLNGKGQETTVGYEKSTAFVHDFELQCSNCGEIRFPQVLYDLDKYELQVNDQVDSKDSLDFLYQTLVDNPTIVIELAAHTDSRGSDKYNEKLSQQRAETCVQYLISKGIAGDRMVPQGYGEQKPYIDAKTGQLYDETYINGLSGKEAQEIAHQKNRRTVFQVLRDDYVPKTTSPEQPENN